MGLFSVGEFFGGVLAEVGLQERLRLWQRQMEVGERFNPQPERTSNDVEHVPAVLAIIRQKVKVIPGNAEGRCDQSRGLSDAVVRGHDRSRTDHRLGHLVEQIELAVAQRVAHQAMRLLHAPGRHAD